MAGGPEAHKAYRSPLITNQGTVGLLLARPQERHNLAAVVDIEHPAKRA